MDALAEWAVWRGWVIPPGGTRCVGRVGDTVRIDLAGTQHGRGRTKKQARKSKTSWTVVPPSPLKSPLLVK